MVARVDFESHGRTLRLETSDPSWAEALHAALPPGWQSSTAAPQTTIALSEDAGEYVLTVDGTVAWRGVDRLEAAAELETAVSFELGKQAPGLAFVHAGAIAWNGRVAILPGRSMFGKSTLTRALLAAGATYFSDEYAVVDAAGMVHPYPRPLALRHAGRRWPERVTNAALGAPAGTEPLPAGAVIATRYVPGSTWRPRRLSPGRAALAMFEHALGARTQPAATWTAVHAVADRAAAWAGPRGEADESAARILEHLALQ